MILTYIHRIVGKDMLKLPVMGPLTITKHFETVPSLWNGSPTIFTYMYFHNKRVFFS